MGNMFSYGDIIQNLKNGRTYRVLTCNGTKARVTGVHCTTTIAGGPVAWQYAYTRAANITAKAGAYRVLEVKP